MKKTLLLLLLFIGNLLFAEIGVNLIVSGDDAAVTLVNRYLKKQIESIDGLTTADNSLYEINVVTLEIPDESGYKSGIVIVSTMNRKFEPRSIAIHLPAAIRQKNNDTLNNLYYYPYQIINSGNKREIKLMCREIVNEFIDHYFPQEEN
jgi:hypothetical protein